MIPWPARVGAYFEEFLDRVHLEVFLDLDDEEVDHLFVGLQQVNGVLTLTYDDFALFVGDELSVLVVDDERVVEVEGSTHHRHVLWVGTALHSRL